MKKKFRAALAVVLSVIMALFCGTVAVLAATADDGVARIGSTYYDSLDSAYSAAKDGDTIVVLKDVTGWSKTITKTITLKSETGREITGVSISVGSGRSNSDTPGNLTVAGNLKLASTGAMFDVKNGTLTIQDDVYAETTGNYVIDNDSGEAKIVINIKGGELVGNGTNAFLAVR